MIPFLAILTGFSAFMMLVAGSLSLLRNPNKLEHQWFFALTVALAIWMPANFFDSNVVKHIFTALCVKIDFSFAIVIAWFLLQFVVTLVSNPSMRNKRERPYLAARESFQLVSGIATLVIIGATVSGLLFKVSIAGGSLNISTTNLFWIYDAVLGYYFAYALSILGSVYIKSQYSRRQGLDLICFGFLIAIITNLLTNLVFPSLLSQRSVIKELNIIGYFGILALVSCLYIAITSRKLFDIRLVVARSLAYVLLILFVGALYVGLTSLVGTLAFNSHETSKEIALNVSVTFFAAITFQYVRGFFSRVTNRVFFRDNYEPQAVLNDLNAVTTATLDIDTLIRSSTTILEQSIKSSFCYFILFSNNAPNRVFGPATSQQPDINEMTRLVTKGLRPHVPLSDEFFGRQDRLQKLVEKLRVDLITPLYVNKTLIGYIAFGIKQNGVAYNQQDVRLLTIAADSLSVAVQNALRFEEIEEFNVTLQRRVDDATRKLRRTNEKLKVLDETKDDFISMASHQLRTPLTSVKGYVSLVLDGDAGKIRPEQRQLLNQAFTSSQRMVYLISDLLNVSRLKTGKFVIEASEVNLASLISDEISQLQETAAGRSVTILYDKPHDFPDLLFDETKIRQVIMNFMDNAIYYTQAGGEVRVQLIDKPETIELRIVDNGIGVPRSEQHHLFNKFYRAGNARKVRPDGTGLGLFMAKKVIIAQGGAVIFDSQEGKGSTFGFVFSKAKLAVPVTKSKV